MKSFTRCKGPLTARTSEGIWTNLFGARIQKIRITGMNQYPHPVHAAADSAPNKGMSSTAWSDVSEMDAGRSLSLRGGSRDTGGTHRVCSNWELTVALV